MPRISNFMRQNLQAVFKVEEDATASREPSNSTGPRHRRWESTPDRSMLGGNSMAKVAIQIDEQNQGVSVAIAPADPALELETEAIKLDITPLLSVAIHASEDQNTGEDGAEMRVTERESSHQPEVQEPLVAVNLSVVPEQVCTILHASSSCRDLLCMSA